MYMFVCVCMREDWGMCNSVHVCVHMCACVYVRETSVYVDVYIFLRLGACACVYMHVCMCMYLCLCVSKDMCVREQGHVHVCTCVGTCVCTCVSVCERGYVCTYVCESRGVHVCTCICSYVCMCLCERDFCVGECLYIFKAFINIHDESNWFPSQITDEKNS